MNNSLLNIFTTSIGKKYIMAFAGLYLSVFLVIHLIGNLFLLIPDNGQSFLEYAKKLENSLFIRINQVILYIALLIHFLMGIRLVIENRKARGNKNYSKNDAKENSSFAARYMGFTALLVLSFIILHLISFSIPHKFHLTDDNMYQMVTKEFSNIFYAGFYVISMFFLGLHLKHGFSSAFQTVGLNFPKYNFVIKTIGFFIYAVIPFGFAFISIFLYIRSIS